MNAPPGSVLMGSLESQRSNNAVRCLIVVNKDRFEIKFLFFLEKMGPSEVTQTSFLGIFDKITHKEVNKFVSTLLELDFPNSLSAPSLGPGL